MDEIISKYTESEMKLLLKIIRTPVGEVMEEISKLSSYFKKFKLSNLQLFERERIFLRAFTDFVQSDEIEVHLARARYRFVTDIDRAGLAGEAILYVLPMKTCVYDLKTYLGRAYTDADLFSKCFDFDYKKDEDTHKAFSLLKSIFSDPNVFKYAVITMANWLDSRKPNDNLLFFTGVGSDGKSLLMRSLSLVFGRFSDTLKSSFFSNESNNGNTANPVVKGLKTIKVAFVSEPEAGKLKTEFIKKLCGSDEISARNLYDNFIVRFKLRTNFVIAMDDLSFFSSTDYALWRRVKIIPLESKFVEIPKHKNEKKIYPDLGMKIGSDSRYVCVKFYDRNARSVSIRIRDIKNLEDEFKSWLEKHVVYKLGLVLSNKELFNRYEDNNTEKLYLTKEQR
ncbi:primase [Vairimorpha necatrix]|uniref:Primase n=1 Tax=Vairimorpha necatrix TaxID=6039 RepID=A0AAX4JD46_9MICR